MRAGLLGTLMVLAVTVVAPVQAAAKAHPDAGPAARSASGPATVSAAPWCNKVPWKSGKRPARRLAGILTRIIDVANKVDTATDYAALLVSALSLGSAAVPSAIAKIVAKGGKALLTRTVKSLRKQVRRIAKKSEDKPTGVKLKIKCKLGFAPYPSLSVYT